MKVSLVFSLLLTTVGLSVTDAQQYTISTYAGGAPAPPTAAISIAADPFGNLYFVDGFPTLRSGIRIVSSPPLTENVIRGFREPQDRTFGLTIGSTGTRRWTSHTIRTIHNCTAIHFKAISPLPNLLLESKSA